MYEILKTILLSLLPISELRGGLAYAIAVGMPVASAFIISVISNVLVIPVVFFFLDYLHKHFLKIKFYENLFHRHIERSRKKIEKHIGTKWEYIFLWLFVAIPLPMTGAYTGTLLAWFFRLDRKKSYLALALGVVTAGIIVTLFMIGLLNVF